MNKIEHYKEELQKVDQIRDREATERQMRLDIAETYLIGQQAHGISRREVMRHYMKKYYQDFLDNPHAESMTKEERYNLLKELIYKHEILHEAEQGMGVKRAA